MLAALKEIGKGHWLCVTSSSFRLGYPLCAAILESANFRWVQNMISLPTKNLWNAVPQYAYRSTLRFTTFRPEGVRILFCHRPIFGDGESRTVTIVVKVWRRRWHVYPNVFSLISTQLNLLERETCQFASKLIMRLCLNRFSRRQSISWSRGCRSAHQRCRWWRASRYHWGCC